VCIRFKCCCPQRQLDSSRIRKLRPKQIRSVAVERVGQQVGQVPATIMLDIEEALRLHLAL